MSDYTGEVAVGGPTQTRVLPAVEITKVAVSPMGNNAYLLRCTGSGEALLIDAANESGTLSALIAERAGGRLGQVVTTHRHGDHWQALAAVVEETGAVTAAGRADAPEIPVATRTPLDHGSTLTFGTCTLTAIHLVGHTPGSIALAYEDPAGATHLFTGDSLFPGGPGKTWSADDFTSLMNDLEAKVFGRFDDNTWVYPGHGDDTTLGAERPHLTEWRERGW